MIIANLPYGRLGNQLQLAAHLITFSLLENRRVCFLYLNERADVFPYFANSPLRAFPAFKPGLRWVERILLKIYQKLVNRKVIPLIDFLDKNEWVYFDSPSSRSNPELGKLRRFPLSIVRLWRFRSVSNIRNCKSVIKEAFTPCDKILKLGANFIDSLRCDVVVGVHIRWGDYKTACPDVYHDIAVYRQRMIETRDLLKGKSVGFVVCTEEQMDLPELSDLNCVFPKSSAIVDLYTLAQTDLLIGSSSTFSEWAAYWGDVSCYTVIDPNRRIESINDFVPIDLVATEAAISAPEYRQ